MGLHKFTNHWRNHWKLSITLKIKSEEVIIKKIPIPKRHHFVPIFYLDNFCNKSGLLWIYDCNKKDLRKQTPKNTTVQTNYYSFIGLDKKKHNEVETYLSGLEGDTKPIIDKINNKEIIDLNEKLILTAFISLLRSRVPYFEKEHDEILDKVLKIYNKIIFSNKENTQKLIEQFAKNKEEKSISPESMMNFIKKEQYTIKVNKEWTLESMFDMARAISLYLFQMDWYFYYSSKSSFITSDNPFVLIPPSDYEKKGIYGLGILTPGVKKIIPLTQKACLVICDKGDKIEKIDISSKEVREINCYIAKNCDNLLISKDRVLLKRLIKITNINKSKVNSRVEVSQHGNLIITRRTINDIKK